MRSELAAEAAVVERELAADLRADLEKVLKAELERLARHNKPEQQQSEGSDRQDSGCPQY